MAQLMATEAGARFAAATLGASFSPASKFVHELIDFLVSRTR